MELTSEANQSVLKNLWNKDTHTFSSDMLKLTAIITMMIDHIGAGILEYLLYTDISASIPYNTLLIIYYINMVLRLIGRIAFPIFCFLLVQGFLHTRSRIKYARNFLIFALISELPFDFCFFGGIDWSHQNVFLTLCIGLLTLWALEVIQNKEMHIALKTMVSLLAIAISLTVAAFLKTDYTWTGVLLILGLYFFREKLALQCSIPFIVFLISSIISNLAYVTLQESVLLCLSSKWTLFIPALMIYHCNGKRYMQKGKYFFYAFYPVHLAVLYVIQIILTNILQ
ncbi:MAG: TraX family protein [Lachnospiraceae bacterium]|nr:TraX family protein [Lachnospiraceae bacterium]